MIYRLFVKEEARIEMLDTYFYYEQQQAGLGERFLSELEARFSDISTHPEYFSFIDSKQILRDVKVEKFPFVIVYEIAGIEVIVYAIHLTHKHPRE